ncbi:MAG: choice-of-anchor D domain-containing protein [Alphaproteobacteria bacterium]|nr:choice-of-anchor D domain-containing protein [Alphaproteobacteria bacterium]MCB9793007.1 choice-of-anchor D domain-containing protein [Alphaproteobacteria bacterium]
MSLAALALLSLTGCIDYDLENKGDEFENGGDTGLVEGRPEIEVTPLALSFEAVPLNCPTAPVEVTVRNRGTEPLTVSDIAVTNNTDSMVLETDLLPFELGPGESNVFDVRFTPPGAGEFSGALTVYSNDEDEPEVEVTGQGRGIEGGLYEEIYFQDPNASVDVIWVVDNSGSMSDVVAHLSSRFQDFIDPWLALGEFDWQMGVITTDMDNPLHQGRLQGNGVITPDSADPRTDFLRAVDQGDQGSGNERGFDAVEAAITSPLIDGYNAGLLRDGVPLYVIFVSDEDDASSMTASSFVNDLVAIKGDISLVKVAAICGGPGGLFGGCNVTHDWSQGPVTATGADKYVEATELTASTWSSICAEDYAPALNLMATLAAGMNDTFYLSGTPTNLGTLFVYVDGVEAPYGTLDGWTYDASLNAIVFHGDTIPPAESQITIEYELSGGCDG